MFSSSVWPYEKQFTISSYLPPVWFLLPPSSHIHKTLPKGALDFSGILSMSSEFGGRGIKCILRMISERTQSPRQEKPKAQRTIFSMFVCFSELPLVSLSKFAGQIMLHSRAKCCHRGSLVFAELLQESILDSN